jgi:thiol-disulfide isomerase/thioredoxin
VLPGTAGVARLGDEAPPITLPSLDGRKQVVLPARGRVQLINYWASWCAPCRAEMPLLDRFAASQAANGTQVTGIALDEPAAVRAYLARLPVRYRTLIESASGQDSSVRLGNTRQVLPFTVLVDAEGRVARLRAGAFRDEEDLRRWATLE